MSAGLFLLLAGLHAYAEETDSKTADEIRTEALKAPIGPEGRPFPLAATWAPLSHNFSPEYQLGLIKQGHHLILCFHWPYAETQWGANRKMRLDNFKKYFEPALKEAARLKLPISFQRFQFEMELTTEKKYFELPPEQNPNVSGLDGKLQHMVDPMGPIELWSQLGKEEVSSECMRLAQEIYPDPPLVIFLSNNEHQVLNYHDAEKSKRFVDKYGTGTAVALREKIFAEELIRHYRALQEGMRNGLANENWKKNAKFVAYEAFGPPHLGRYGGWVDSAGFSPESGRMIWQHLGWDGGSPSYYTHDWAAFLTDYNSASIQVEAMNWVFMLKDVLKENHNFWFELSTWDGDQYGINGKREQYAGRGGQIYNADRYQGLLQFGLWLLRPRALRDFRYLESLAYAEAYFLANVKAVDQVYASPLLRKFWRKGELVPNESRKHPYQSALTDELKKKERWYLLETDLESPAKDWGLYTEIPVFPLALVLGKEPQREWLVFAHAPKGARTDLNVTLPGFGKVKINASVTGSFYHVKEQGKSVECVIPGGPLSAIPESSANIAKTGETVSFKAGNVFNPGKVPLDIEWDFGDGTKASGLEVSHAYVKKGQYFVSLTAKNSEGETSLRYLPISVGYPELDKCLLFLPLEKSPEIGIATERVQTGALKWFPEFVGLVFAANTKAFCGLNLGCDWAEDKERGQVLHLSGKGTYVAVHPFYDFELNKQIPRYDALGRNRTVCMWFKADDVERRQVIYQDGSANADVMNIYLDKGSLYAGTSSGKNKDWEGTWLSTPVEARKWYHVAVELDNADPEKLSDCFKLYLNGKLVSSGKALLNRPFWARIGGAWSTRFHDGTTEKKSESLNGYVDNFAVFLNPLSEEEIKKLMKE